jgi:hypothetical protein
MATVVGKFRCSQIPELRIIGLNSTPVMYLVHAQQGVGMLTGKETRQAASNALHNFLRDNGKLKNGGDLLTAFRNGAMTEMMYTYYFHNGSKPSYFLTMEGVSELLRTLPGQVESSRRKFQELFDSFSASSSSTFELDMDSDPFDDIDEPDHVVPDTGSAGACMLVQQQTIFDCYRRQTFAEKKCLEQQVKLEQERVARAEDRVRLEQEKTARAEDHVKFERERTAMVEEKLTFVTGMKDVLLDNERLKYALATEKADRESHRLRVERDEALAKVARLSGEAVDDESIGMNRPVRKYINKPLKLMSKLSYFVQLQSTSWDNDVRGVNCFLEYVPGDAVVGGGVDCRASDLIACVAKGVVEKVDAKYHIIGFFYKGGRVTEEALQNSKIVKEVYGVEVDGFQYMCIVLYVKERNSIHNLAFVPYVIIPSNATLGLIDQHHHISVYDTKSVIDDPVLAVLKKPSDRKWKWFNSRCGC